jgi:hypothetical protein
VKVREKWERRKRAGRRGIDGGDETLDWIPNVPDRSTPLRNTISLNYLLVLCTPVSFFTVLTSGE